MPRESRFTSQALGTHASYRLIRTQVHRRAAVRAAGSAASLRAALQRGSHRRGAIQPFDVRPTHAVLIYGASAACGTAVTPITRIEDLREIARRKVPRAFFAV